MFKIFHSFLVTLFFALHCQALELSSEESSVLEKFFRVMLEKIEGGYVLFEKKPVCINGFHVRDDFTKECETHIASVFVREGAAKWKRLNLNCSNQDMIIHIYNHEDSLVTDYIHILFINRDLFLGTVKSNLPLFQYVLGPDITPAGLLEKLTDPNTTFHSVLKNDKVLIGILLGYGTQNSLYVSRIEQLQEALLGSEQPPLKSLLSKPGEFQSEFQREFQRKLLLKTCPPNLGANIMPSFGYVSLKEEIQGLVKKIDDSSQSLAGDNPHLFLVV